MLTGGGPAGRPHAAVSAGGVPSAGSQAWTPSLPGASCCEAHPGARPRPRRTAESGAGPLQEVPSHTARRRHTDATLTTAGPSQQALVSRRLLSRRENSFRTSGSTPAPREWLGSGFPTRGLSQPQSVNLSPPEPVSTHGVSFRALEACSPFLAVMTGTQGHKAVPRPGGTQAAHCPRRLEARRFFSVCLAGSLLYPRRCGRPIPVPAHDKPSVTLRRKEETAFNSDLPTIRLGKAEIRSDPYCQRGTSILPPTAPPTAPPTRAAGTRGPQNALEAQPAISRSRGTAPTCRKPPSRWGWCWGQVGCCRRWGAVVPGSERNQHVQHRLSQLHEPPKPPATDTPEGRGPEGTTAMTELPSPPEVHTSHQGTPPPATGQGGGARSGDTCTGNPQGV